MATSFRCVLATLAVALLLPAPFAAAAPRTAHHSTSTPSALELAVLAQLNQVRAAHGLVALKLSGGLTAASVQHSREMGADGYFDHSSADGTAFWRRIQRSYPATGRGAWSVGENIAFSSPDLDATEAMKMWMASPGHRANILNPTWREIGVAAVQVAAAPGVYEGMTVTIITTDFGVRR